MSLRKYFFKNKFSYRIYLYYNLYIRHKGLKKRTRYSQWGEDYHIFKFFENKTSGIYLDIGCFHPYMYSNTCLLFNNGWKGINIDINPTSIDLFKIARPNDVNLCTTIDEKKTEFKFFYDHPFSPANTLDKTFYENYKKSYYEKFNKECFVGDEIKIVTSKSIDEIFEIAKFKEDINFLNIDVEGMDLKIIKQLIPSKLKPELISIETHDPDGKKSDDCDRINDFLQNNDYSMFKRVGPTTLFSFKN